MLTDYNIASAFLVGLMGGVHCIGMCGVLVGAISAGLPGSVQRSSRKSLPFVLAYNAGRISSYTFAGLIAGGLGEMLVDLGPIHFTRGIMQLFSGCIMILLGLYLARWWMILIRVERAGMLLWKVIEPVGRHLLPVSSPAQAYVVGLLWGWLPCGLVYTVLIWSFSAGNMVQGGLLMLSFGVGTLPLLLVMGLSAAQLTSFVQHPWSRAVAGILVSGFGVHLLIEAIRVLSA